jgi:hypothetical protein
VGVLIESELSVVDRSPVLFFFVMVRVLGFIGIPAASGDIPGPLIPSLDTGIFTRNGLFGVDDPELLANFDKSRDGIGGVAGIGELAALLFTLTRAGLALTTATALSRTKAEAILVRARLGVTLFLAFPSNSEMSVYAELRRSPGWKMS